MEFKTGEISFEDSALGKCISRQQQESDRQIEELKRIADAAQKQAELAEKRAIEAEAEAKKEKREKLISSIFAFISFLASVIMWLFTREEIIAIFDGLFQ